MIFVWLIGMFKCEVIIIGSIGYNKYRDMNNNKLVRYICIKCNVYNLVVIW